MHRPRIKNWGAGGGTRGFGSLRSFPYPKAKILGWREDWVCPLGWGVGGEGVQVSLVERRCKLLVQFILKLNNRTRLLLVLTLPLPALAPDQMSFSQWREPLPISSSPPRPPGPKGSAPVPTPSPTPTRLPPPSRLSEAPPSVTMAPLLSTPNSQRKGTDAAGWGVGGWGAGPGRAKPGEEVLAGAPGAKAVAGEHPPPLPEAPGRGCARSSRGWLA